MKYEEKIKSEFQDGLKLFDVQPKSDEYYQEESAKYFNEVATYANNKKRWFKAMEILTEVVLLVSEDTI